MRQAVVCLLSAHWLRNAEFDGGQFIDQKSPPAAPPGLNQTEFHIGLLYGSINGIFPHKYLCVTAIVDCIDGGKHLLLFRQMDTSVYNPPGVITI
jgi:hypothetical protein